MLSGIVMVGVTGLLWTMIGVVMSDAARRELCAWDIMRISAFFSLVIGMVVMAFELEAFAIDRKLLLEVALALGLAGAANGCGVLLMQQAMRRGHHGAVWVIAQSALLLPFLMGVLCFGERVSVLKLLGVGGIMLSMCMFGLQRGGLSTGVKRSWLFPAFAAFLLFGSNQCLANLPSYWNVEGLSAYLRAFLFQVGTSTFFLIFSLCRPMRPRVVSIKPALLICCTAMVGQYLLFYQGLDMLARAGAGSIGFPVTVGACIIGFCIYSIFIIREKTTAIQYAAVVVGMAGMLCLSL